MMIYHIRVQGHLPDRYSAWFDPLTITREASGETLLTGELVDQSALFGMLLRIRDLGLPLLTVSPDPGWDVPRSDTANRHAGRATQSGLTGLEKGAEMTTKQLTVTGFMTIQPGTEQILLPQIDALVAKTRAEPGCINYDFHQHNADPRKLC